MFVSSRLCYALHLAVRQGNVTVPRSEALTVSIFCYIFLLRFSPTTETQELQGRGIAIYSMKIVRWILSFPQILKSQRLYWSSLPCPFKSRLSEYVNILQVPRPQKNILVWFRASIVSVAMYMTVLWL